MSNLTVRLAAVVASAAAVLAAVVAPASAAAHPTSARNSLVIGQVQYDSPGRDDRSNRSLNAEWVTVVNAGRSGVDLAGWTLSDESRHVYRFHHLRLGAHQWVRVHTGIGRDTGRDVYQDRRDYVWNNNHDTATLRNARGYVVNTKSWGYRR